MMNPELLCPIPGIESIDESFAAGPVDGPIG